jgi:cephalosporin hydroxylase
MEKKDVRIKEVEKDIISFGSDDIGVFGGEFQGGIFAQQIPDELAPCIVDLQDNFDQSEPWSYLEIGVAAGGLAFIVDHYFKPDKMVLIDDNLHHKAKFRPEILKAIQRVELVGKSFEDRIVKAAQEHAPYYLMMIDGDHHYPGVKLDFTLYSPMLDVGGFLMFHDSALKEWGVYQLVMELKEDQDWELVGEYVSSAHYSFCGLTLFRKVR